MSTALDPALTRLPPPRDCQLRQTLLCPYSSSHLPEIVNYLEPYSTRTPASLRLSRCLRTSSNRTQVSLRFSTTSDPALPRLPPPQDCQVPQNLIQKSRWPSRDCQQPRNPVWPEYRLPKIFKCLRPYSAQIPTSPRSSSASGPTLPKRPLPRDCQLPWTLLCTDSRLHEIDNCLGPPLCSALCLPDNQLPLTLLCSESRLPETASDANSLLSYNLIIEY